ncbi:hypothetical protein WG954_18145 [Lacibacter sp. H375]|uniref:hypothetical protein n=1 Tax=Lacibacter sp. H375 TaxID=3133424 RepID=UPI0030BAD35F
MKNLLLYLLLIIAPVLAKAQYRSEITNDFATVEEAAKIAQQIVKASGMKINFMIAEGRVPNAAAVLVRGQRFILYNPAFMDALNRKAGTDWAAVSVLAHEIGHHLYGTGTAMASETKADEFSGFVLEKMGASLAEAQAALRVLPAGASSVSHPEPSDRLAFVADGWNKSAGNELMAKDEPTHMTKGELIRSDSRSFPYIWKGSDGNLLYVHLSGTLVDENGKVVGKLKRNQ